MSKIGKIARWTVVVFCPAIDSFPSFITHDISLILVFWKLDKSIKLGAKK